MDSIFPILIVEDERVSRKIIVRLLSKAGYNVTAVGNGREALEEFDKNFYPLVLTDWIMPEMDGIELSKAIRKRCDSGYVYVIMLTNKDSQEDIITGLEAGADDYLTKPVHLVELMARINNGTRILDLERNLKKATEEIYALTITDSLTETYNWRYLNEHLPVEIDRALKQGHPLSVVLSDIDYFKKVNDMYGHVTGDMVLRSFARIIRDTINDQKDWVVRYGGEEFLIVLPESNLEDAHSLSEMIREFVAQATIKASGHIVNITASFGVAGFDAQKNAAEISPEKLLNRADEFLYRAKEGGRNRVAGEF